MGMAGMKYPKKFNEMRNHINKYINPFKIIK